MHCSFIGTARGFVFLISSAIDWLMSIVVKHMPIKGIVFFIRFVKCFFCVYISCRYCQVISLQIVQWISNMSSLAIDSFSHNVHTFAHTYLFCCDSFFSFCVTIFIVDIHLSLFFVSLLLCCIDWWRFICHILYTQQLPVVLVVVSHQNISRLRWVKTENVNYFDKWCYVFSSEYCVTYCLLLLFISYPFRYFFYCICNCTCQSLVSVVCLIFLQKLCTV